MSTPLASALPIVPYEHDRHEAALLSLYRRMLGGDAATRRRAILESIHRGMPGRERAPLRLVVLDGETVAGTLGCLPADFLINGVRVPVRFTCDLLVDPRYAAAGLRLARRTLGTLLVETARLRGDFFVGGMWMTHSSHQIHLAAGFDDAMVLPSYTLALDPKPFVARRGLNPLKAAPATTALRALRAGSLARARLVLARRGASLESCDRFGPALDETWLTLARGYAATRVRDAAYLNWKYADHPGLRYRCLLARRGARHAGYLIWRTATRDDETRRAVVVDFLVAKGDSTTLRTLVSRVILDAKDAGMESLSVLTTQRWASSSLRGMGFLRRRGGNAWVVAGWANHVPRDWLHDPQPWHLCMGDSDGDIWAGTAPGRGAP